MAYRRELPRDEIPESVTPSGLEDVLEFPLVQALLGRHSRRFFLGARIPDGPLAFTSRSEPVPLSDLEQMLLVTAVGGNTGWHYLIARNEHYAPSLSNYAGTAGGRTFPSAAGFHTSELFFTDDSGSYFVATRDASALGERDADGQLEMKALLAAHHSRIRKVSDKRLYLPPRPPHVEGHNTWVSNQPGTTLFIPVGGPGPAPDRHPLLSGAEQLLPHRPLQPPAHSWPGAFPRAGGRGPSLAAVLRGAAHPGRVHRGAVHRVLRRHADAAGHGAGRLHVRRAGAQLGAGGER